MHSPVCVGQLCLYYKSQKWDFWIKGCTQFLILMNEQNCLPRVWVLPQNLSKRVHCPTCTSLPAWYMKRGIAVDRGASRFSCKWCWASLHVFQGHFFSGVVSVLILHFGFFLIFNFRLSIFIIIHQSAVSCWLSPSMSQIIPKGLL